VNECHVVVLVDDVVTASSCLRQPNRNLLTVKFI
jgi:hypothetical protein